MRIQKTGLVLVASSLNSVHRTWNCTHNCCIVLATPNSLFGFSSDVLSVFCLFAYLFFVVHASIKNGHQN